MSWLAGEVLDAWGELAARVTLMLELARAGRWERLPELDAHCAALFLQLQDMDMDADDLGAGERAEVLALALRVRTEQEELRQITQPQFTLLAQRMQAMRQEPR